MVVFCLLLGLFAPNLEILLSLVCSLWLCGSIAVNPIICRLVPSPFRLEIRQWQAIYPAVECCVELHYRICRKRSYFLRSVWIWISLNAFRREMVNQLNYSNVATCCSLGQGRVAQSPIKLTQDKREFWFEFCNFSVRFSVYIVCSSVLSLNNFKLHKT